MNICNQCNEVKSDDDYYVVRGKLLPKCKNCCKANSKIRYDNNKEAIILRTGNYRKLQKEHNTDVYKKSLHNGKLRQAKYQKTDQGKIVNKACQHRRRVILKNTISDVTTTKLKELLTSQNDTCFYCNNHLDYDTPRAVHLDHIMPLSKGGLHQMNNVVWSCSSCNLEKSNKIIDLIKL